LTPFQHGQQIAHDFMLATALRKRFGSARAMLRSLGFDEATSTEMLSSYKENDMPNYDRRRTGADRRRLRAMDENEDPVEYLREMLQGLEPEEAQALIESLSGDRRRRASDEPEPFPGRPNPGGSQDPIFDKYWRKPGEDRRRAEDRRRFAHDAASGSRASRDAADDFRRRFPSTVGIRIMG
jgi:hypothetical protein